MKCRIAGDPLRLVAGEEHRGRGEVGGLADPAGRLLVGEAFSEERGGLMVASAWHAIPVDAVGDDAFDIGLDGEVDVVSTETTDLTALASSAADGRRLVRI